MPTNNRLGLSLGAIHISGALDSERRLPIAEMVKQSDSLSVGGGKTMATKTQATLPILLSVYKPLNEDRVRTSNTTCRWEGLRTSFSPQGIDLSEQKGVGYDSV